MAFHVRDEVMLLVGVLVLAMCIILDVWTAYNRGAKWLPGFAVVIYALFLQLIGYLDVQNVSIGSRHKDQQLEALVSNQYSIDSSRVVLFVFVGYLLPNLASTQGFWANIAALFTSLSTHVAIELCVALQSRVSEKDKVVKGQSGIWLIVSGFVMFTSIIYFSLLIVWAVIRGRFIRDNVGSRIPLALESPGNNIETMSWDTYQSEMLKSWIVARVSQPEYVLSRSDFSFAVVCVVIFNVVFMGVKVIFLRSQLQGPFPLFTLQCIFIILGWFAVCYRCLDFFRMPEPPRRSEVSDPAFWHIVRFFSPIVVLSKEKVKGFQKSWRFFSFYRCPVHAAKCQWLRIFLLCMGIFLCSPLLCILTCIYMCLLFVFALGSMELVVILIVSALVLWLGFRVPKLRKKFFSTPPEDEDFPNYKEDLERVCMPRDNAEFLWAANKSSFNDIRQRIQWDYERGRKCEKLQKVIGSRLAEIVSSSEDVKELLEPLKSVSSYFPLLKDSFRAITAFCLRGMVSETVFKEDAETVFKETEDLMDFLDCPDNVGTVTDIFKVSNSEAFVLKNARDHELHPVSFEPPIVEEWFKKAEEKLKKFNLLESCNAQTVDIDWSEAAKPYAMYKICKVIKDRPPLTESVEQLKERLFNMLVDLIASCVRESPKILLERSRKWAAEFREDKISAAIKLAGFARGVIDGPEMQHLQVPSAGSASMQHLQVPV